MGEWCHRWFCASGGGSGGGGGGDAGGGSLADYDKRQC